MNYFIPFRQFYAGFIDEPEFQTLNCQSARAQIMLGWAEKEGFKYTLTISRWRYTMLNLKMLVNDIIETSDIETKGWSSFSKLGGDITLMFDHPHLPVLVQMLLD